MSFYPDGSCAYLACRAQTTDFFASILIDNLQELNVLNRKCARLHFLPSLPVISLSGCLVEFGAVSQPRDGIFTSQAPMLAYKVYDRPAHIGTCLAEECVLGNIEKEGHCSVFGGMPLCFETLTHIALGSNAKLDSHLDHGIGTLQSL
jgi:hypothetical protein